MRGKRSPVGHSNQKAKYRYAYRVERQDQYKRLIQFGLRKNFRVHVVQRQ